VITLNPIIKNHYSEMSAFFDQHFENIDFSMEQLQADFRNAVPYAIHAKKNRIRKAILSKSEIAGLLDQYGIVIE